MQTVGDIKGRHGGRDLAAETVHSRLAAAVEHASSRVISAQAAAKLAAVPACDPNGLAGAIAPLLPGRFSLSGTLDRRLLLAERTPALGGWTAADLSGHPHNTRAWPAWTQGRVQIGEPGWWLSAADLTGDAAERLARPRVLVVSLYHREWFPLPRFPLAISDLARAARATLLGRIQLMDMQLGVTLDDIIAAIAVMQPDIVGVSATFGQHDLMITLLDYLYGLRLPPLVLAGGSLTARNEAILLDRYPRLIVARSAGEPVISDVMSYFHGDLDLQQVRGIGYAGAARGAGLQIGRAQQRTATLPNRQQTDFLPELDLLDQTFAHRGVAQLEASRGCTSACSFCPRSHKGSWAQGNSAQLPWMLAEMGKVFDRHPGISRTLYLVDEELIGRGDDAVPRARGLAEALCKAGFAWESSCRVDQVTRPDRDRGWHVERGRMWRQLTGLGLRRMLFGVESGVTSVLERFNKETSAEQNALAIRTLSALGVPTRFTYITFDQLMTTAELKATHAFLGSTDLLLRPLRHLDVEQIIDGVRDPSFVAEHSTGRPFFTGVSYMLVSMECLIGAAYTKKVTARGLARQARPSMGRVDAEFADWRIGLCSGHAQLWVDRNFALDYTLKSLEKILDGEPRRQLHQGRILIRIAGHAVLTRMLVLVRGQPQQCRPEDRSRFEVALIVVLDQELDRLADSLSSKMASAAAALPGDQAALLVHEYQRWQRTSGWHLINAADACGT